LVNCELKLVQSTVIGVVLLQLLFVTGVGFLTGGTRAIEQELHSTATQLNHTLLAMGVLATLIPAVMLSASERIGASSVEEVVTDNSRAKFLALSRGMAIILLLVYVASRWYLYDPPGEDNTLRLDEKAPKALHEEEEKWRNHQPEVGPGYCMIMLIVAVALVAGTAEWASIVMRALHSR
jgi:Ca2+:H+ antiporter